MVVRICLSRWGCSNKPFYRVIAANSRAPRDGKHLDVLGYYNPLPGMDGGKRMGLDFDRVKSNHGGLQAGRGGSQAGHGRGGSQAGCGRGGFQAGRVCARAHGRGRVRKQPGDKFTDQLDKELETYHAEAMNTS